MKTGRWGWKGLALLCLFAVTGCVSASLEDAAPTSETTVETTDGQTTGADASTATAPQQTIVTGATPEETEVRDNSFVNEGATLDDTFPTFETPPTAANKQISDEEKEKMLAEMEALKASMKRRGASSSSNDARYRELQDLARQHVDDTKKQIEQ